MNTFDITLYTQTIIAWDCNAMVVSNQVYSVQQAYLTSNNMAHTDIYIIHFRVC